MITVTVRERTIQEARLRLSSIPATAAMVELRLDDLASEAWEDLLGATSLPLLVTCRAIADGGGFAGSEEERVAILERALNAGVAKVDIELGTAAEDLMLRWPGQRLVLSHHDFQPGTGRVQETLTRLLASSRQLVVKLAYTAGKASEILSAREMLQHVSRQGRKAVIVSMGEKGIAGRLLAPSWGSQWTYACCDGAPPAAPGQLSLALMADLYRVDAISSRTVLTGILGWPVAASLSPWMHNRALQALEIDGCYLPFPEESVADFLLNAEEIGLSGLSVTHPHKEALLPWVGHLSESASGSGAINTLQLGENRISGDNTDGVAARRALQAALPGDWSWEGRQVAIAGAGGAARAVAWELGRHGAEVTFFVRTPENLQEAAVTAGARYRPLSDLAAARPDILVHATPVGMHPNFTACLPEAVSCRAGLVFDLVSNPRRTALLEAAARNGSRTQEGLEMLVRQGEAQFLLWHGVSPPAGVFAAAAREGLKESAGA